MGALLDIVSIVILVACVWSAARRGFIKTIIGLVGTLAAVVLASAFGPAAASVIRTRMVGPFFERTVGDYLMTYMSGVGESAEAFAEQFNQLLAEMPKVLEAYLRRFSVSPEEVRQSFESSATIESAREAAVSAISTPLSQAVSSALGFLLVFVAALLLIKLLTVLLDTAAKLPVLRSVNKGLGVALGALQGVVIVCFFAGVMTHLAPFLENYMTTAFDANTISSTLVFKYFYELSPFKRLL